jgi:hypothetical protein
MTATTTITAWLNNCYIKEPCAICSAWIDSDGDIGFSPDTVEERMNTCDDCVREHAPDLLAAVDHLCKAGWRGIDDERVTHLLPFEGLTLDQIKAATRELIDIGHVSHTHAPGCSRCDPGDW